LATISDVSRHAGVSRSTVSRVVAGNGYVSEAKREAIEKAIAELGYRPNTLAQALRSNRSNMIGAVVVDVGTPYFANVVFGMQRAARGAGKSLMVSSGYADQDEEARAVTELVDRSCDGLVLFLERPMRSDAVEILRRAQIPVVSIGRDHSFIARGTIVLNNYEGARQAVTHLLAQGHPASCISPGRRISATPLRGSRVWRRGLRRMACRWTTSMSSTATTAKSSATTRRARC
jgi:LacI family transcriptional regulator